MTVRDLVGQLREVLGDEGLNQQLLDASGSPVQSVEIVQVDGGVEIVFVTEETS